MTRRKNLVSFGQDDTLGDAFTQDLGSTASLDPIELTEEYIAPEPWLEESQNENVSERLLPALAGAIVLAWSAFFVATRWSEMIGGADARTWSDWIVAWSVPVLLVAVAWLLVMRTSRRESRIFGQTARALAVESQGLETRLATVNRELSLAREFIAAQSRDLESLGRVAADRLSANAETLQALIRNNGEEVDRIGNVSEAALGNMDRLRDHLPVIANAARDVTSQIGNAGETAQTQIDAMVDAFDRLDQANAASDEKVVALRGKVDETIAAFTAQASGLADLADRRFAALRDQTEAFRADLDLRETDVLAAIRRHSEELGSELAARSIELKESEANAIVDLRRRLEIVREEGEALSAALESGRSEVQSNWTTTIEQLETRLRDAIAEVSRIDEAALESAQARLVKLHEEAQRVDAAAASSSTAFDDEFERRRERHNELEAEALAALDQRLASFDARIAERQKAHLAHVGTLVERGEDLGRRLAEIDENFYDLSSGGEEAGAKLAATVAELSDRLSESRAILQESGTFVGHITHDTVRLLDIIKSSAALSQGELSDGIGKAEERLGAYESKITTLNESFNKVGAQGELLAANIEKARIAGMQSQDDLAGLEERVRTLAEETSEATRKMREELGETVGKLEEESTRVLSVLRDGQADALSEISRTVVADSSEALEKALRENAAQAIAELEASAFRASEAGRNTAAQLRDQLAMVNDLAGNLEQRVAVARERAEESIDVNFTQRMGLITESLNSSAIDITKVFDDEIADTLWEKYLRGDRGVFTRRAVRLLGKNEARSISELHESDAQFRDTVNRYIHDFEAMLRNVLSTREGNALAVTLLSSDIGRLYVALAQSIDRLRN